MNRPSWRVGPGLAILAGVVIPVLLYWALMGRASTVSVGQAKEALGDGDAPAMLVDVRSNEAFDQNHLDGAVNWPYDEIMALRIGAGAPEQLKGGRLLLICDSGILSAVAARRLHAISIDNAASVRGGMQAWVGDAERPCGLSYCRLRNASGETSELAHRDLTTLEQYAAVIAGFGIKPAYMLLALALILVLRRSEQPHRAALRWALLFFLAGEAGCAVNYIFFGEREELLEYAHSAGMVICFSLAAYAAIEAVDRRILGFSDPGQKCAAVGLCRGCIKHTDTTCRLKRLFLLGIAMLIAAALMPLCAAPSPVSYNAHIFGSLYNYTHAGVHQLYEIRFCPIIALLLLVSSFLILWRSNMHSPHGAKVLLAAGIGPLGFSFFRLGLLASYRDNMVWFVFWEEATELLFTIAVAVLLYIFARRARSGSERDREEVSRIDSSGTRFEA